MANFTVRGCFYGLMGLNTLEDMQMAVEKGRGSISTQQTAATRKGAGVMVCFEESGYTRVSVGRFTAAETVGKSWTELILLDIIIKVWKA